MKDDVYSLTLWAKNISKDFLTSQEFVTRDTRIQVFNVISSKSKPGCVCFPNVLATLYNFSCQLLHLSVTFEQAGQFWGQETRLEMLFTLHCPCDISHCTTTTSDCCYFSLEALRLQISSRCLIMLVMLVMMIMINAQVLDL